MSFFLSLIPSHAIDHLTTMCQPHGFVVIDCDCSQPIVAFVGFHVCPLLEIKHGLCAVHFSYIVCPFPLGILQPKVSEFPQVHLSPLMLIPFSSPMPMPLWHISSFIYSLYLLGVSSVVLQCSCIWSQASERQSKSLAQKAIYIVLPLFDVLTLPSSFPFLFFRV